MKNQVESFTQNLSVTPEQKLWIAVLETAVEDALTHKDPDEKEAARKWFREGGSHFKFVCDLADFDPDYVRKQVMRLIN
ncbi:MAG: hypothetical protein HQL84_11730 [Magnetococcales bacterium]|nr:hypothetical protein [Magnetococcales bacterium]MBF0150705.1 hypothetical protein [Magnetococcales bacterium]MBF0174855.1 hypothetical protein [Magnetococcales bacterium]MBF0346924.1 hypothetical protein [Magnetococcales bacterium]MBF0631660.1 hypothetical protein [Magnetococcales bacterium]